jgi:hypothetical protein
MSFRLAPVVSLTSAVGLRGTWSVRREKQAS